MHLRVSTPLESALTSIPSDGPQGASVSLILIDDGPAEAVRETLASMLTLEADPSLDILVVQTRPETGPVLRDILRVTDAVRILQRPQATRADAVRLAARAAMAETLLVVTPGLRLRPGLVATCLDLPTTEGTSEVHIGVRTPARPTARPTLEVLDSRTLNRIGAVVVDPPSIVPGRAGQGARPTLIQNACRLWAGMTRAVMADRP